MIELYLTKLAASDPTYRLARMLSGQGGDFLLAKRKLKMAPINQARDELIRRELRSAGYRNIADNPKHFENFKVLLSLPRTSAGQRAAQTLAEESFGAAAGKVSDTLVKRVKNKLVATSVELGTAYLQSSIGDRASESVRSKGLSNTQIRQLAKKYAMAMQGF